MSLSYDFPRAHSRNPRDRLPIAPLDNCMSTESIRKRRLPVSLKIVVLIVLAVAYVLSTGPVNWLFAHGHISLQTLRFMVVLYAPLTWACDHIPSAANFFEWYIQLWVPS